MNSDFDVEIVNDAFDSLEPRRATLVGAVAVALGALSLVQTWQY
jgi:hypothetical protein